MNFRAIDFALPSRKVTNADMISEVLRASAAHLDTGELAELDELMRRGFEAAGTDIRFLRAREERPIDLVASAARGALARAGMEPEEIDLLIYVGIGRGFLEPASADIFQDVVGLRNATAFDLLDACASWVRALHVAHAHFVAGDYRRVMILNGEFSFEELGSCEFRALDEFAYRFPTFTVGEAATATILAHDPDAEDDEYHASFRTWGEQRNLCMIPLPGVRGYNGDDTPDHARPLEFFSYGGPLLRFGARELEAHYRADRRVSEYPADIYFGHAASERLALRVVDSCGIERSRFYGSHARFGNTVSASVPLAMAHAQREGRLESGHRVTLGVASAGVTTAFTRFRFFE